VSGIIFIFRARLITHFMPVVQQVGDIHIEVKNDTAYITSKLSAENKTFLKIEIDTLKYKVTLFNKTYLQNQKFIGIILHGYGKDTIDFSLKIPYLTILNDLNKQRKVGDSASYAITISLQYSTFLGKSEFPVNRTAKLKIPQPPELEIVDIKYKKVRLKSILADAQIRITNYNEVALTIKELSYSMKIINQGNLKGRYMKPIDIKPNGTTFISMPIEMNPKNLGKTMFQIAINRDEYNYTLTLNAILESSDSLKRSFRIDLTKSGKMELKK
jgi:LEA14-like dessication related protein